MNVLALAMVLLAWGGRTGKTFESIRIEGQEKEEEPFTSYQNSQLN